MIGECTQRQGFFHWLALIWIALQIPFLSSAFRIDEPYYLAITKQILKDPFDPYGFQINWKGTLEWTYKTFGNPPLVPLWLSGWQLLFPWNETSFHLAILPFSLTALWAFGYLAKHYQIDPKASMLLLVCSPAFFLGSQVIMLDVPMLCLFILSIASAFHYETTGVRWALIISFTAAFLCPMAKYNGLVVLPVLLCMIFMCKRKLGMLSIFVAPILSLILWNLFSWLKYGEPHYLVVKRFSTMPSLSSPSSVAIMIIAVLASLGLGVLPLSLVHVWAADCRRNKVLLVSSAAVFLSAYQVGRFLDYEIMPASLFAFSVSFSGFFIYFFLAQVSKSITSENRSLLPLAVWFFAGLAFQATSMFTSVRYLLILGPPAILLTLAQTFSYPKKCLMVPLIALNLLLVIGVAVGDRRISNAYRTFVFDEILPLVHAHGGKFYFDGHWGFQYYSEMIGGEAIDALHLPKLGAGDLMVVAASAWPSNKTPEVGDGLEIHTREFRYAPDWMITTMDCQASADFYANVISGCSRKTFLPFGYSRGPSEKFLVHLVQKAAPSHKWIHDVPIVKGISLGAVKTK